MTKYKYFLLGLSSILITFNCQAELALPVDSASQMLIFDSSLSEFKSINNEQNDASANEMEGMNHDNMTPEQMKKMPKPSTAPTNETQLKPIIKTPINKTPTNKNPLPADTPINPHQNHQM